MSRVITDLFVVSVFCDDTLQSLECGEADARVRHDPDDGGQVTPVECPHAVPCDRLSNQSNVTASSCGNRIDITSDDMNVRDEPSDAEVTAMRARIRSMGYDTDVAVTPAAAPARKRANTALS